MGSMSSRFEEAQEVLNGPIALPGLKIQTGGTRQFRQLRHAKAKETPPP
jgi:hypothetical protein